MHVRHFGEPLRLYSWTIVCPPDAGNTGALGVTVDHGRALSAVTAALRDAPTGSRGLVHRVALSFSRVGYFYEGLVARCQLDPDSGGVVWDALPPVTSWSRSAPAVTDPPDRLNDGMPPEAVIAGSGGPSDPPAAVEAHHLHRSERSGGWWMTVGTLWHLEPRNVREPRIPAAAAHSDPGGARPDRLVWPPHPPGQRPYEAGRGGAATPVGPRAGSRTTTSPVRRRHPAGCLAWLFALGLLSGD